MIYVIDLLKAAVRRQTGAELWAYMSDVGKQAATRSDNVRTEAENSRSPLVMRRQAVSADLARMMGTFGIKSDSLPLFRDELLEAEHTCALCRHVGRCRAWSSKGCQGDAPRLFCANVALFEEVAPDPFWSETAPGCWHADTLTSPVLRLLASSGSMLTEAPPRLNARGLERFISVALAIDALLDRWSPSSDAPTRTVKASRTDVDLDAAIDGLFDDQEGLGKAGFARILQVALCDRRLAAFLCRLYGRSEEKATAAQLATV